MATQDAPPQGVDPCEPLVERDDLVRASGELVSVRHLVLPSRAWWRRDESADPAWCTIELGGLVIAYRVTL